MQMRSGGAGEESASRTRLDRRNAELAGTERTLTQEFDVTVAPNNRLANALALQRAKMLLLNQDDYF